MTIRHRARPNSVYAAVVPSRAAARQTACASRQIFKTYDDIVTLCCEAWNRLIDQPWKIMSIGRRKWAHGF